jgi:hypothetical protein
MIVTQTKVLESNLDLVLERSRVEFLNSGDSYSESRNRFKAGIENPLTDIYYYEIKEWEEVAASFMLVYGHILFKGEILKVCFLTQVIVSGKFRGRGLSYQIAKISESAAVDAGAAVSFVIARKIVKDLYFKLGFIGFSHFSEVALLTKNQNNMNSDEKLRFALESDCPKLLNLYQHSYKNLNFSFLRNVDTFKSVLESRNFEIYIARDLSFYLVCILDTVIEVGMSNHVQGIDVIEIMIANGLKRLRINAEHEIIKSAKAAGFYYSQRFEQKEGHLLKAHQANLSHNSYQNLDIFFKSPGAEIAEVAEIDQW